MIVFLFQKNIILLSGVLILSIIGLDDTSVVTKIPKTSTKVFGPIEFIFGVLRVNIMVTSGKTAEIPANLIF